MYYPPDQIFFSKMTEIEKIFKINSIYNLANTIKTDFVNKFISKSSNFAKILENKLRSSFSQILKKMI